MPSPTAEHLTEAISGACAIAPQLKTDAAWLYIDAYWPQRNDRDRPSRPRPPGVDADAVPGRRLDLGVGNDQARAKYLEAATLIVQAHRLAGHACSHWSGRRPPSNGARRPAVGVDFPVVVDATVRRLRQLTEWGVVDGPDDVRVKTHGACTAIVAAHAALLSVMRDVDGTGEAPLQRRCKNCQGPAAEGRTECWRCIHYRIRNKGRLRPVPRNMGAFAARDRRRERGEDFGDNPLPRGRYVEGRWTEAS